MSYWYNWDCSLIQTCTPNSHLYRVTYKRCRIDTIETAVSSKPAHQTAIYKEWHIRDVVLIQLRLQSHPNLHTKRSSIQSDIYQMSYWYNWDCSLIHTCTPNGHLYRVTYKRCRIDTIETAVSSKPAHQTVIYTEWHIRDVVLIQLRLQSHPNLHTKRSSIQSDI